MAPTYNFELHNVLGTSLKYLKILKTANQNQHLNAWLQIGAYILEQGEAISPRRRNSANVRRVINHPLPKFLKNKICQTNYRSWIIKLFNEELEYRYQLQLWRHPIYPSRRRCWAQLKKALSPSVLTIFENCFFHAAYKTFFFLNLNLKVHGKRR